MAVGRREAARLPQLGNGEPNDARGREDVTQFLSDGKWNDIDSEAQAEASSSEESARRRV